MNIKFVTLKHIMCRHNENTNSGNTFKLTFIAVALILSLLLMNNSGLAQASGPSQGSKDTKSQKCELGLLPTPACQSVSNRGQANSGNEKDASRTEDGGQMNDIGKSATETDNGGTATGTNNANSAINQNQQSTQLCASGNVKALPHSTIICNNNADLGQANNGNIEPSQTANQ